MKTTQDHRKSQDIKPNHVSHDSQSEFPNTATDTHIPDSTSVSSNDNKKVSREDIELVQNLIERCLQLYMNRDQVVKTLFNRARIDPGFTKLVWQKLEEENADFFRAYYIRLKLKNQITLFNQLLEQQRIRTPPPNVPLAPLHNGIHPMPVHNLPMGYPVMQHPTLTANGQPHIDPMGYAMPNCHIVNGVPASGNFHPMRMHSGNDMVIDSTTADVSPIMPSNNGVSSMSDIPVSPTSVASSGHFPFSASEMPGMGVDTSALDTAFTSDVASSVGLDLPNDNGVGNSGDCQIPWNFSLADLTALSNFDDLGGLGNYPGSPYLPSDSDILFESPDDLVEEFFVDSDSVPGQCPLSDEEKS